MKAIIQRIPNWRLFQRTSDLNKASQIISWWESRRFPFNVIVGSVGILTCLLIIGILVLIDKLAPDSSNEGSPFLAIMGIFVYGIAANICYTGGWVCEILAKAIWKERAAHFGQISFALGTLFSIILTLVPALFCLAFLMVTLLRLLSHHA